MKKDDVLYCYCKFKTNPNIYCIFGILSTVNAVLEKILNCKINYIGL